MHGMGIFKAYWAVVTPDKRFAANGDVATVYKLFSLSFIHPRMVFITHVSLVPPGASNNNDMLSLGCESFHEDAILRFSVVNPGINAPINSLKNSLCAPFRVVMDEKSSSQDIIYPPSP